MGHPNQALDHLAPAPGEGRRLGSASRRSIGTAGRGTAWLARHRHTTFAAVIGTMTAWGGIAAAAPYTGNVNLPSPYYTAEVEAFGNPPALTHVVREHDLSPGDWTLVNTVQRTISYDVENSYTAYASAKTSNDNLGTVSARVYTSNYRAAATASMRYWFTVVGPDAASIPIRIAGYGRADAASPNGVADAFAEFQVYYQEAGHRYASSLVERFDNHQGGNFSDVINVQPNLDFTSANIVTLTASARLGSNGDLDPNGSYSGEGYSWVDPMFSIADPALASQYTILYGLSVVVSPPPPPTGGTDVPEPASWAVLLTGLGLLAGCRIRKAVPGHR